MRAMIHVIFLYWVYLSAQSESSRILFLGKNFTWIMTLIVIIASHGQGIVCSVAGLWERMFVTEKAGKNWKSCTQWKLSFMSRDFLATFAHALQISFRLAGGVQSDTSSGTETSLIGGGGDWIINQPRSNAGLWFQWHDVCLFLSCWLCIYNVNNVLFLKIIND